MSEGYSWGRARRLEMPSGHRPGHRAELHSPSIVASTAPPGQNSIMIWGNKERGLKPGCASLRKGREEETKAAFASPRGKAAPQPHPACGSSQDTSLGHSKGLLGSDPTLCPPPRDPAVAGTPPAAPYLTPTPAAAAGFPAASLPFPSRRLWEQPCQQDGITVIAAS